MYIAYNGTNSSSEVFILLYIYFECLFQKKILIFLENFGMPRIMVKGKKYYFILFSFM